jgi:flagellin-specific chaperone FliS
MIFILKTMPSIKLLKKEINNDIGDFIEEIYLWELSNPNGDLEKSEKLIDEAIQIFDDLMVKINAVSGDDLKSKFKAINQEHIKLMHSLLKKSAAL